MKIKIITTIYWVTALIHIISGWLNKPDLHDMSKTLLMPLLIYLLFAIANGVITLPRLLLGVALIFSWGGDILLITKENETYFLAGLGSFLIAQLLYSYIMLKSTYQKPKLQLKPIIPVLVYGLILLYFVIPKAETMAAPIVIYSICILAMVSSSLIRQGLTANDSFLWTAIGAVLFILSDSMIAINKFVVPIPLGETLIMATYITAQYLIVRGILKHPGG